MKFFTFLLSALMSMSQVFGQAPPEAFNYSGAAVDGSGDPLSEETIGVEFSILESSASGTVVYREQHTILTDVNGVFNLGIGLGSVQEGVFSTINWGENSYFLKVGVDPGGGTSYTITGVTQLLSVPYALYAKKAGGVNGGIKPVVDVLKNNGYEYFDSNVKIALEGIVYSEGSSVVTESGFVWSESPSPTVNDNKLVLGTGGGWFEGKMSIPLSGRQDVYYKAYALSENGASYSKKDYIASVNPLNAQFNFDSIGHNAFNINLGINLVNPSGSHKAQICWDTVPNSRNPIGCTVLGQFGVTNPGYYEIAVGNLLPNTTYYFSPNIAYSGAVITGDGITSNNSYYYGEEVSVTTDTIFTDYDGIYVGILEQNNINTIPNSFADTIYVTVDHVNLTATVKSKFFYDVPLEINLKLLTSNIINRSTLIGLEYENTTDKPLVITGASGSVNFPRNVANQLNFLLNSRMVYPPRNTLFDNTFPVNFTGEYIKQ